MRSSKYAAAFARIRAIRGNLLEKEKLEEILNAKTLEGIIEILKKTPYGKERALPFSREGLERAIKNTIIDIYTKVLEFLPENTREFLRVAVRRFEIDNIKKILTSKLHEERTLSEENLLDLGEFSVVPISELLSAKSLPEIIEKLRKTPYGKYIEGKLPDENLETIFAIEMVLDYGFFKELIALNKKLDEIDRKINSFYFGLQCDLLNLTWVLRARNFFGFSEEKIFSYTVPFGTYLNNEKLRKLAKAKGFEEFLKPILDTPWGKELEEVGNLKDPALETRLLRKFYETTVKSSLIKSNPFSIGSFIELLCLKEMEIHDLTTIIESKAYDLPLEKVKPFLLMLG